MHFSIVLSSVLLGTALAVPVTDCSQAREDGGLLPLDECGLISDTPASQEQLDQLFGDPNFGTPPGGVFDRPQDGGFGGQNGGAGFGGQNGGGGGGGGGGGFFGKRTP